MSQVAERPESPESPTSPENPGSSEGSRSPEGIFPLPAITVVTGHYGCGKTNLAINLALDAAGQGQHPTLVDLDIVNPYFRSSDYTSLLEGNGVRVIAPVFAGTTLDTPSLPPSIYAAIEDASKATPLIMDVGGDDAGASALGRFAQAISSRLEPYTMLYVINRYRDLRDDFDEYAAILTDIQANSHLAATGVVNNSNLMSETGWGLIESALPFAHELAERLALPLVYTTVPKSLEDEESGERRIEEPLYPVKVYLHTPWEE